MTAPTLRIDRAVKYGANAARDLFVDIYHPASEPIATLIFLHGGGWVTGGRTDGEDKRQQRLAAQGLLVISADYTLAGEEPFPRALEDVYSVVSWARSRGFAPTERPLIVAGASAGGHLAALSASRGLAEGRWDAPIDGVVAWFPTVDILGGVLGRRYTPRPLPGTFHDRIASAGPWPMPNAVDVLLGAGAAGSTSIESALQLDPRTALASVPDPAVFPPHLILVGTADRPSRLNSELLYQALRAHDLPAELIRLEDADHEDSAFGSPALVGVVRGFALGLAREESGARP